MYDTRQYPDRFEVYRPTAASSDTGERTRDYPGTPTASAQPCLFSHGRGRFFSREQGLEIEHDAEMRFPASIDVRADSRGENPDKVVITQHAGESVTLSFVVAWVQNHHGKFKTAFLKETA